MGMQRANFQQRFFWSNIFCIVSSIVLVEQDLIFLFFVIKLKIIIFNLFIRFKKIKI